MKTLVEQLDRVQSNFRNELRELLERIEKCEKLGNENTKKLERLDKTFNTELSKYYSNRQEDCIPYIFDAPDKNPYFSGRSVELEELQRTPGILHAKSVISPVFKYSGCSTKSIR